MGWYIGKYLCKAILKRFNDIQLGFFMLCLKNPFISNCSVGVVHEPPLRKANVYGVSSEFIKNNFRITNDFVLIYDFNNLNIQISATMAKLNQMMTMIAIAVLLWGLELKARALSRLA